MNQQQSKTVESPQKQEQSQNSYVPDFKVIDFPVGLTFDDVLLVPQYSEITSRSDCEVQSRFSRNVPLKIPIVSSPMDTVTEDTMARQMAMQGGIGIIHRFCTVKEQAAMVKKVKRAMAWIVQKPHVVNENITFKQLQEIIKETSYNTFLVVKEAVVEEVEFSSSLNSPRQSFESVETPEYTLSGIITKRDMKNIKSEKEPIKSFMTPQESCHLLTIQTLELEDSRIITAQVCKQLMHSKRVEKLPILNQNGIIVGLVTLKDLEAKNEREKQANIDALGRLYVGAAVGAKEQDFERAEALVNAGVDVLVIDVANGHSKLCVDAVQKFKNLFSQRKVDIVAGSIATADGALQLIEAGADGIRCGIGNGAICITRIVAGSGIPQFSALIDVAPVCRKYNIPLISDGGNRNSGNMCKALAIGADCIMLGRLVAGTEESPSQVLIKDDKLVKIYRGMAGYGANLSKSLRTGTQEPNTQKFSAEGVEGYIPYVGPLKGVLTQFVSGIRSGMSYSGAFNLKQLRENAKFIRITASGIRESGVHDINKL